MNTTIKLARPCRFHFGRNSIQLAIRGKLVPVLTLALQRAKGAFGQRVTIDEFDTYTASDGAVWQAARAKVVGGESTVSIPAYGVVTLVGKYRYGKQDTAM